MWCRGGGRCTHDVHTQKSENSRESALSPHHGFQGLSSGCQCSLASAFTPEPPLPQSRLSGPLSGYFKSIKCYLQLLHCEINYFVQYWVWWDNDTLNYKIIFMKIMQNQGFCMKHLQNAPLGMFMQMFPGNWGRTECGRRHSVSWSPGESHRQAGRQQSSLSLSSAEACDQHLLFLHTAFPATMHYILVTLSQNKPVPPKAASWQVFCHRNCKSYWDKVLVPQTPLKTIYNSFTHLNL